MKGKGRIIFWLIVLILVLAGLFVWQGIYLPKEKGSSREILFEVEPGQGAKEISLNLEKEGIIKSAFPFKLYVALSGDAGKLKAGLYKFSPAENIPAIVTKMSRGEVAKEKLTIIEGWNLRDIGEILENKGMFQREELFKLVGFPAVDYSQTPDLPKPEDFSEEFEFLKEKPKNVSLEGYLFPDTYEIYLGGGLSEAKRKEMLEKLVKKMLQNFEEKVVSKFKGEIEKQGKSLFEVLTMASLLEKEVPSFEDKKLAAGVLWKRLKIGMPLQVDATITYITGKKTTKISREETKIANPYNTYKYYGLPLGPICNPGLESIKAALYPKDSDYLYYLTTPDGKTIFSRTLEEHNIAKAKYLK